MESLCYFPPFPWSFCTLNLPGSLLSLFQKPWNLLTLFCHILCICIPGQVVGGHREGNSNKDLLHPLLCLEQSIPFPWTSRACGQGYKRMGVCVHSLWVLRESFFISQVKTGGLLLGLFVMLIIRTSGFWTTLSLCWGGYWRRGHQFDISLNSLLLPQTAYIIHFSEFSDSCSLPSV